MLVTGANFPLHIQLFLGNSLAGWAGTGVPLLQPWKIVCRKDSPREG